MNRAATIMMVLISCLAFAQAETLPRFDRRLTRKQEQRVKRTLAALTLDEKIGQLFIVDAIAVFMNRDSEQYKQLRHEIVDSKIGGFILSRSDVWATAVVTNRLQQTSKVPLLIASDLEAGVGIRLNDTTTWPPNIAVAATGDVKYARLQGAATGREARAVGINWAYAPVADVNSNPDNPVINVRSYGEDPQSVAAFTSAFIEGAQGSGIIATAKHFPGHGDTTTDSHIALPVVDVTKERLDQLEFVPFRAAIASGVGAIMTAHIALPQIEPEGLPSTLSSKVLTGILREELRFNGLIVTDAMDMSGVAKRFTPAESAVRAIQAGADMILECCTPASPDAEIAIRGVKEAVIKGEISEARLNASVERILRAKAALGLFEQRTVNLGDVDRVVSAPELNAVAQEIAERSITLVRDERKSVPTGKVKILNVTYTDDENRAITLPFVDELRRGGAKVAAVAFDSRSNESELNSISAEFNAGSPDVVIYSVSVRTQAGKGTVALPPMGLRVAEQLNRLGKPLIVISFGNPYLLTAIPDVPAYIAAYSAYPVSQLAAARAVLGEIPISGKLPITLPGLYPRGHGLEVKAKLSQR